MRRLLLRPRRRRLAGAVTALAQLSDIPVGTAIAAKDNGKPIILSQPTAGTVKAFSAICTHMGCTVAPSADGKELDCPCHGSKYNATTGAVIHGPAPKALAPVAVKVVGRSRRPGLVIRRLTRECLQLQELSGQLRVGAP